MTTSLQINDSESPGLIFENLLKVKENIGKFWKRYNVEFREWWSLNSVEERENFISIVYPTIVYSVEDRYSFSEQRYAVVDGKFQLPAAARVQKVYQGMCDRFLDLEKCSGKETMTLKYLAAGTNLPDLIDAWGDKAYLVCKASELVVGLRQVYRRAPHQIFGPNSWKQYQKQVKVRSGDILYVNRLDDSTIFTAIKVNNPSATINGSGTLGPSIRLS
jgi:hypothetical protein